mmetsp:Transcript_8068/g.15101  ORF Transcript_8068/g.15101 Transcript_8068/m.15101 type:complete len:200 (-) Transcript_8068:188-787(-)
MTCRTLPTLENASAARCMSQNQSKRAASSPSLQSARPAMKNGDDRKSCVSAKTSSHVPAHSGANVVFSVGFNASSVLAACRTDSNSVGKIFSPLELAAAIRKSSTFSLQRSANETLLSVVISPPLAGGRPFSADAGTSKLISAAPGTSASAVAIVWTALRPVNDRFRDDDCLTAATCRIPAATLTTPKGSTPGPLLALP